MISILRKRQYPLCVLLVPSDSKWFLSYRAAVVFPWDFRHQLYYFSFPVYHQISLAHTFFSHRGLYLLFPTPKQCSNTVTVSWIQQAHRNNIKVKSPSPDTCAGFRFGSILLHIDNSSQNQMSLGMRISQNESYLSLVMHTCVIDNSK